MFIKIDFCNEIKCYLLNKKNNNNLFKLFNKTDLLMKMKVIQSNFAEFSH